MDLDQVRCSLIMQPTRYAAYSADKTLRMVRIMINIEAAAQLLIKNDLDQYLIGLSAAGRMLGRATRMG